MIFLDPLFPVFLLATILLAQFRQGGLAPASLALCVDLGFALLFLGWVQTAVLLGFSLTGFALLQLAGGAWRGRLYASVGLMVGLFIVLKKYSFLPDLLRIENLPVAVGLSYVLFRQIHLIVDRAQGGDVAPGLIAHLQYSLNCQALLSGPFQRYDQHRQYLLAATRAAPMPALARMANGFLKVVVVAPVFKGLHPGFVPALVPGMDAAGGTPLAMLATSAVVWMVFMYFNFSGYMDIVIGWARLCRLDLPENFDRPWLADSFLDFWGRWHMTMTGWFKTYLFTQFMVAYGRWFPECRVNVAVSGGAFFFTFLLVGAWHGPNWPFIVCGLFLGLGATANQVTRELLRKRRRKQAAQAQTAWKKMLTLFSAGATFVYVAVSVMPFWLTPDQYAAFLRDLLFQPSALLVLPLVCAAFGALMWVLRLILAAGAPLKLRMAAFLISPAAIALRIAVLLMFILSNSDAVPDFIYKGL